MFSNFFSVLALAFVASAFGSEMFNHPEVTVLTKDNFKSSIADDRVWFVKFFAPWCGHCKKLAPTWAELGEHFEDDEEVAIAQIDCTDSGDVCKEFGARGYPTLKAFHLGKEVKQYSGKRELDDLIEFVDDILDELDEDADEESEGEEEVEEE